MTEINELSEAVAEVERKSGVCPSAAAIKIASLLLVVGDETEAMGARDQQADKQARPPEYFAKIAADQLQNNTEKASLLGRYLTDRYAEGYKSVE